MRSFTPGQALLYLYFGTFFVNVAAWGSRKGGKDRSHGVKVLFQGCAVIAFLFIFILNFYKMVYFVGNTAPGRLVKRVVWENVLQPFRKYMKGERVFERRGGKNRKKKMAVINMGAERRYEEEVRAAAAANPQENKKNM